MMQLSELEQQLIIEKLTGWDERTGIERVCLLRKWQIIPPNVNWVECDFFIWYSQKDSNGAWTKQPLASLITTDLVLEYARSKLA